MYRYEMNGYEYLRVKDGVNDIVSEMLARAVALGEKEDVSPALVAQVVANLYGVVVRNINYSKYKTEEVE